MAFYFRTWTVDEEIWLWDWQAPPLPPGPPPSPQRPWLGPVLSFGINRRVGRSSMQETGLPAILLKVNTDNAQAKKKMDFSYFL